MAFRTLIGPPLGARAQRCIVALLTPLMPGAGGTARSWRRAGGIALEVVAPVMAPVATPASGAASAGAILYLHGGAFCLAAPPPTAASPRGWRAAAGMPVWVPDYRLAPEHPHPAALEDALTSYAALRAAGHAPGQIVIAGIPPAVPWRWRSPWHCASAAIPAPAALLLLSPVTDPTLGGDTLASRRKQDPMIRRAWLEQGLRWYDGGTGGSGSRRAAARNGPARPAADAGPGRRPGSAAGGRHPSRRTHRPAACHAGSKSTWGAGMSSTCRLSTCLRPGRRCAGWRPSRAGRWQRKRRPSRPRRHRGRNPRCRLTTAFLQHEVA